MSPQNVEVLVRVPLTVRADSHRRLDERFCIRFPGAAALVIRALRRWLPRRSRLSRELLRRLGQMFLEAYNRRDFDSTYALYHPDSETIVPHQLVEVGFEPVWRGDQAALRVQQRWHADWGEFRIYPDEAIDLGDRFLALGRIRGSGLSSGAGMETEWGNLFTVEAGWIVREQFFFDRAEALEAAGLPG